VKSLIRLSTCGALALSLAAPFSGCIKAKPAPGLAKTLADQAKQLPDFEIDGQLQTTVDFTSGAQSPSEWRVLTSI